MGSLPIRQGYKSWLFCLARANDFGLWFCACDGKWICANFCRWKNGCLDWCWNRLFWLFYRVFPSIFDFFAQKIQDILDGKLYEKGGRLRPLFLLYFLAEERGFEPLLSLHLLSVFETDPFNRLGIPPLKIITQ